MKRPAEVGVAEGVTHRGQRLADGGQDVGAQRVQQQLVLGEDGEQQRAGVLRAEVLQQLQEARTAVTHAGVRGQTRA